MKKQPIFFTFLFLISILVPSRAMAEFLIFPYVTANPKHTQIVVVVEKVDEAAFVVGETVTFSITPNDEMVSLSTTSEITDSNGQVEAWVRYTSRTAGPYTLTISVGTQSLERSISPYIALSLSMSSNNSSPGPGTTVKFTAIAKDRNFDDHVAGKTVTFSVSPDDATASLNPTSATTNSNGQAQTTLTLGSNASGSYTVTATVKKTTLTSQTVSTSKTVRVQQPPAPSQPTPAKPAPVEPTPEKPPPAQPTPSPPAQPTPSPPAQPTPSPPAQPTPSPPAQPTPEVSTPVKPVSPPVQQPDETPQTQQPVSPPVQQPDETQQPDDTQQTTVQPPVSTGGGGGDGGQITNPTPTQPVNHTVKPFDYEREGVGKVVFSEWMISKLDGAPQWVELYNTTNRTVNIQSWKIVGRWIDGNDKVHILSTKTIPSLKLDSKETCVIVSFTTTTRRQSSNLDNKVYSLRSSNAWSGRGIVLELQDGAGNPIDRIGNMNEQDEVKWKIPWRTRGNVNKERRISLIRRLKSVKSRKYNFRFGMTKFGWFPADDVEKLTESRRSEYFYGSPTDIGTPGYRTEGADPLPVTLSSFIAQAADGQVVLSWTTASEIENAGFNLFRSQSKEGPYVKVNQTLITGAGTTSERHAYIYRDSGAQPNVAYFYQIEDVSFSGVRQRLATVRMRGHISAAGKFTVPWGGLKTQN